MYAFMQAMGLANDYIQGCAVRASALRARANCKSPMAATADAQKQLPNYIKSILYGSNWPT
jgi:hypothetical protein